MATNKISESLKSAIVLVSQSAQELGVVGQRKDSPAMAEYDSASSILRLDSCSARSSRMSPSEGEHVGDPSASGPDAQAWSIPRFS